MAAAACAMTLRLGTAVFDPRVPTLDISIDVTPANLQVL